MADNSSLPVASGNETFANDDIGGVKYPRPKMNWGPDGTANDVDVASGKPLPVQLRGSDGTDRSNSLPVTVASGGIASGALASGSVASGAIASGAVASGAFASGSISAGAIAAGATSIADNEDAASADGDRGVKILAVRKATPANTSGTDGDYEFLQMSAGRVWTSATIDAALPAGTNAIGKLAANSGVDIGDVDVTTVGTITPGTAATSLGKAEDAAHTSGDVGVAVWAVRRDTAASGAADGDYVSFNTDDLGNLRVHIDDRQLDGSEYETVAASQTTQTIGATGATGDYLREILVIPATTSPGNIQIKDGSNSAITVFTGGASSVSNLVPFTISLGLTSTAGAWQITTGANVSAIGIGNFT